MDRGKNCGVTSTISTLLDVRCLLKSLGLQYLPFIFRHLVFHMHLEGAL
jgi:hypothetical protein